MSSIKKIWKFISSMKFAIILLVILAAACSVASLVTQGQSYSWYARQYSARTAALILALHLDDAFHSWWFILITAFLCLNLLLCNVLRIPQLIRRTQAAGIAPESSNAQASVSAATGEDPETVFKRMAMPSPRRTALPDG